MLKVIEYGKDEYDFPSLLVLGCFDAIHIGHRELIKKAGLQAKINGLDLGVMLFKNGKGGETVYSFEERLAILEKFKVKFVLVIDFTEDFKKTSPEDFLHNVESKVNVKAYMSGKDFRFGAKAKGKSATLKAYADNEDNGVWYMPVKDVAVDGEKVGTTQIKELLANGEISRANALLGEEFYVCGEVIKGAGRGSELGFPTANIVYPEEKFPIKQGVYGIKSVIDGTEYCGIANYGPCPTFGDDRVILEAHFEGFGGDLYGQTLKISFVSYIRDIEQFPSAQALAEQLKEDKEQTCAQECAAEELAVAQEPAEQPEEPEEQPEEQVEINPAPAEQPAEQEPAEENAEAAEGGEVDKID